MNTNGLDRRRFLRLALGAGIMPASWGLWAAPQESIAPRFLFIFLRGGYDALSALIPYGEPFYYEARPNIAIAPPDPINPESALPLDTRWGLHPSLSDSLMPFWESKQLAFVPFAGTGFVSRSHFQAQDRVELALSPQVLSLSGSGFLNRLLAELGGGPDPETGVSFTTSLPLGFRGPVPVANWPVNNQRRPTADPGLEELVLSMYDGHPLEDLVRDGLGLRREVSAQLLKEMQDASREGLPTGSFALEAARIGRLLRDHPEYRVGFVDLGGWDTHAGQGAARGQLSNRLRELSEGLRSLAQALGSDWQRTLVVVMSEFGRTFRENGSRGTDHGHGTTLWVLGGGVRGGAIRGDQEELGPGDLHQDRDLPVLNEYRDVLAGLLQGHLGLADPALARVFPGSRTRDLGLI